MLSYLQDKRPKRRRSANLLSAFARPSHSDQNHNGMQHTSPEGPLPNRIPSIPVEDQPVSSVAPSLPTIQRIASEQGSGPQRQDSVQHRHWSFKGDKPHTNQPPGGLTLPRPTIATSDNSLNFSQTSSIVSSNSSDPSDSTYNRFKRPIDLRFEQMRSYPEAPFQQSVYNQRMQPHIIPQLVNPPTPPPKSAPAPSRMSQEPDQSNSPYDTVPSLVKPNQRYTTWNKKIFNPPQRQPSVQALHTPELPHGASVDQHRQNKPKLNLKNPMNLLARRRSHKPAERVFAENQTTPAPKLPDDYDPRIRGKVIHDFSAPRTSRPQTSQQDKDAGKGQNRQSIILVGREASPSNQEREHTPVFKEHFDDGLEKSQDPATRSEAFMRTAAVQASQVQPDSSQLPTFARKLPPKITTQPENPSKPASERTGGALEILVESPDRDQIHAFPSPPISPPRASSTAASISDRTNSGIGSPQRYMSTSSRFSFDLAGVGSSAQEKLLEDKHREKAQQKQRESVLSDRTLDDDEGQFIDFDEGDDDGLEERIPGVNCDDETAEENQMPVLRRDMENFQFASPNKSSFDSTASPVSTGVTSVDTPFLGMPWASNTASKSSPNLTLTPTGDAQLSTETIQETRPQSTPGDSPTEAQSALLQSEASSENDLVGLPHHQTVLDDMYFDDGMIDEIGEVSDLDVFDENVFDDTGHGIYGLPLRDRTLQPLIQESEAPVDPKKQTVAPQNSFNDSKEMHSSLHRSLSSGGVSAELRDALTELGQPSVPMFSQAAGLTQDNLAAYNHNNLANAVNQAAMDGAFDRTLSIQSQNEAPLPALETSILEPANQTFSHIISSAPEPPQGDTYDSDGQDDDDIVAAANAEALENDDDGFYGQEFGFFARASSNSSEGECVNGGYFGARGLNDGIHRSHSGKANFQEPSLTPITERSEWSNRNSTISLAQLHGHAFPSPAFDMPLDDMTMQLAMLKQLRRGAWGGSDASLPSSSGSQGGGSSMAYVGPQGMILPSPLQAANSASNLQNMASSFQSYSSGRPSSNDSGTSPEADSPTITLPIQQAPPLTMASPPSVKQKATPASMPPPLVPASAMPAPPLQSPTARSGMRSSHQKAHSRNSSGPESVSYKEEGGKWVMEKRRMSETGETLMVGRSVLDAGTI